MNPAVGWSLAAAALVAGWFSYRWPGLALAATVVVFWLLLQFNRSVRVMRDASGSAVGSVPSAVMLHSKLRPGLTLLQIVTLTKSLGRRTSESPEIWAWGDASGARVQVEFDAKGRCARWTLERPAEPPTDLHT
ncbi:MAG TPA: hypothetical protein VNU71_06795 [Burkholderiaceae bacterium]|nr:hypothetical protein [Burkholderiaceae bacterium]